MYTFYDFEDKEISNSKYEEKPERDFFPNEKYYMVGDEKVLNPDFKLDEAKKMKNEVIKSERMKNYPPLADLADAIYWKEKGDNTKMDKYVADCDKVKSDHPLVE